VWFLVLMVLIAVVLFLFGFVKPLLWIVGTGLLVAWILGTFRRARYGRHHDDYHRHDRHRRY
jgi:hypothetical protein